MKNIELIFSDFCNIYGESYNVEYLRRASKDIHIIETTHKMEPSFVNENVDMIYMGCVTERKQEQTIELLMPYRDRIIELIDQGTIFLVTGNSIEIFGKEIVDGDRTIPALGIFDFTSKRFMNESRHNSQYVGTFTPSEPGEDPIIMLGHKSQFSYSYRDGGFEDDWDYFVDLEIGIGMNKETKHEGIHKNNFFATYSLGPCFIMNPLFAKYLLRKMGLEDSLMFEKEVIEAYEYRLNELRTNLG